MKFSSSHPQINPEEIFSVRDTGFKAAYDHQSSDQKNQAKSFHEFSICLFKCPVQIPLL